MYRFLLYPLMGLMLTVAAAHAQDEVCLQYDDNAQDSKKSMTGGAHGISFECPDDEQWFLTAVSVYGSRYGARKAPNDDFSIAIASEDMKKVATFEKPYSTFERGDAEWVDMDLPSVKVPKNFNVVVSFEPTRTKGVFIGIDSDSTPSHSMTIVPGKPGDTKSDVNGDWMIRAWITKEPGKEATPLKSLEQAASELDEKAAAKDKKILGDAKSITLKHDDGEMDKYMNIQSACYTVEFATPKDVEAYVWQVQIFASQFGGGHDSEAVNGDIYVLDKNRKIISRTSFPYSLVSQKHGWVNVPTLPTRVKGKFFVSLDSHGRKDKGIYIGYKKTADPGVASTDELKRTKILRADWSKKFDEKQWMIRAKVADRPVVYPGK